MLFTESKLLIFEVGPVPCCVDSNSVRIVIEPPAHITAIPGSNSYRPGLFAYNKQPVAVYDVRCKFNLPTTNRGKIIITEMNQRLFGFWVDRIQDVISASQGQWQVLPPECPKELFSAVLMYDKQLIFKTDFDALTKAQVNTKIQEFINKLVAPVDKEATSQQTTLAADRPDNRETISRLPPVDTASTPKPVIAAKPDGLKATATSLPRRQSDPTTHQDDRINLSRSAVTPATRSNSAVNKSARHGNKSTPNIVYSNTAVITQPAHSNKNSDLTHSKQHSTSPRPPTLPDSNAIEPARFSARVAAADTNDNQHGSAKTHDNKPAEPSSNSGIFVLGLILMIAMATIGFLYFPSIETDDAVNKTISSETNRPSTKNIDRNADTALTIEDSLTSPVTSEQTLADEFSNEVSTNQALTSTDLPVSENNTNETVPQAPHDASLTTTDNDITITISDPDARFNEPELINAVNESATDSNVTTLVAENKTPDNTENKASDTRHAVNEPETSDIKLIKPVPLTLKQEQQIIHIVVKGDTLWHIAKRYIHDPFKYSTLAKLSKIKNPDLIYPGNKVIIIIKKDNTRHP